MLDAPFRVTRFTISGSAPNLQDCAADCVLWLTDRIETSSVVCTPCLPNTTHSFKFTDTEYRGGNEFSGVVELSRPMDHDSDITDIEAVLAKNFDLQQQRGTAGELVKIALNLWRLN